MGYRVLFLSSPVKLSVKNEQLLIDNGKITKVPLEDIECIAADNLQVSLGTYLMMKFAEYAITFYVTDRAHHPCCVTLPVSRHSRHTSVLRHQIDMSVPTKKRLQKQIIQRKIQNQSEALRLCGIEGWKELAALKQKVLSGDTSNVEAVAAAKYFRLMFGKSFSRSAENIFNACLNYGYAVLRSTIEKYLIVYGYEPAIGLFHKNAMNNFNLADDVIEAYRPLIDLFVKQNITEDMVMNTAIKAQLVNLLNVDVKIDEKMFTCARAVDVTVQSLTGCILGNRNDLQLPEIIDIKQHKYE